MVNDQVDHPAHYLGKDSPYEVIKVLEAWLTREEFVGGLKFNVYKYLARARSKNGVEDYAKAAWYANYLIEFEQRAPRDMARVDATLAKRLGEAIAEIGQLQVENQQLKQRLAVYGKVDDADGNAAE